jgi:hypothetical protein
MLVRKKNFSYIFQSFRKRIFVEDKIMKLIFSQRVHIIFLFLTVIILRDPPFLAGEYLEIDVTQTVIVTQGNLKNSEKNAVQILQDEIQERTGLRLKHSGNWPDEKNPVICICEIKEFLKRDNNQLFSLPSKKDTNQPEGYQFWVDLTARPSPTILIVGNDSRGFMYGVGRLLRTFEFRNHRLFFPNDLQIVTAPQYPIRGVQLAYRSLPNTYDKWDIRQFDQYIREMIIFGANAIEIHPGFEDDRDRNELMTTPPQKMMFELTALLDEYDLDVWMWYPALETNYEDPVVLNNALKERKEIFKKCKRLDALFVPGGDPGETPPDKLMPFLGRLSIALRRQHSKAELWLSPQGFSKEGLKYLYTYLNEIQPTWLTGLVYGPWVKTSLPKLRAAVPEKYPIRRYPDITHCVRCQYPVPDWDLSFARTLGREPINPSPMWQAQIHNALDDFAEGSIAYSEGVNDDVNKIIWLALEWDPEANVADVLRQYARFLMPEIDTEGAAQGILNLEKNWQGPLISNRQVQPTLFQWQALEKEASPELLNNWRFEALLFRAYYDAFVQRRLFLETEAEIAAIEVLRQSGKTAPQNAILKALEILNATKGAKLSSDLRQRIEELGERLFQHIGLQLSVKKYGAESEERGAVLDFLDVSLNNREWLVSELNRLQELVDPEAQSQGIELLVHWEDPGSGGFYDNLGNPQQQPHLLPGAGLQVDPGFVESPQNEVSGESDWRLSWQCQGQTLFDTPLQLRYENLDPGANYRLRVVYAGRFHATMRLVANKEFTIHEALQATDVAPLEFSIPQPATASGRLDLVWHRVEGRGCQVAEVWLFRDPPAPDFEK